MQYNDRLETLSKRFAEIDAALSDTSGGFDQTRFTALMKERSSIEPTVETFRALEALQVEIASNDRLRADKSDPDIAALAEEEAETLQARRSALEAELAELMLPRDPNDAKDIFIEIRAGAGGDAGDRTVDHHRRPERLDRGHLGALRIEGWDRRPRLPQVRRRCCPRVPQRARRRPG